MCKKKASKFHDRFTAIKDYNIKQFTQDCTCDM